MRLRLKIKSSGKGTPAWLTVFSDMTTNLMLFFLILFAMTRMSEAQREAVREGMERAVIGKAEAAKKRVVREAEEKTALGKLEEAVNYGSMAGYADMEVNDYMVRVTLKEPVLFTIGSADLTPKAEAALETLAGPLKDFPNEIVVEGHTDNIPISGAYRSNWELSIARAVSVIDFLTERGHDPTKLIAAGYGEYRPVLANDTEERRARNRRIEITIVRRSRV
jgi:chemotaxis protein MotB